MLGHFHALERLNETAQYLTGPDIPTHYIQCTLTSQANRTKTRSGGGQFKFSLISPKEFTVLAYSNDSWGGDPSIDSSLLEKFESTIKKIALPHGGATFEDPGAADDDDELLGTSRWRIPLSCYDEMLKYFERAVASVESIPEAHLKATQLHWQNAQDEFPEPSELVANGVPSHLAEALTGYQRQGVAFVQSRDGKGTMV